jgi:hypothetical protein
LIPCLIKNNKIFIAMRRFLLIASGQVNVDEGTDASLKILSWNSDLDTE